MKDLNVKVNLQANITEFNNAMNRAKDSIANSFSGKGVKLFTEEMNKISRIVNKINNTTIAPIDSKSTFEQLKKDSTVVNNRIEQIIDNLNVIQKYSFGQKLSFLPENFKNDFDKATQSVNNYVAALKKIGKESEKSRKGILTPEEKTAIATNESNKNELARIQNRKAFTQNRIDETKKTIEELTKRDSATKEANKIAEYKKEINNIINSQMGGDAQEIKRLIESFSILGTDSKKLTERRAGITNLLKKYNTSIIDLGRKGILKGDATIVPGKEKEFYNIFPQSDSKETGAIVKKYLQENKDKAQALGIKLSGKGITNESFAKLYSEEETKIIADSKDLTEANKLLGELLRNLGDIQREEASVQKLIDDNAQTIKDIEEAEEQGTKNIDTEKHKKEADELKKLTDELKKYNVSAEQMLEIDKKIKEGDIGGALEDVKKIYETNIIDPALEKGIEEISQEFNEMSNSARKASISIDEGSDSLDRMTSRAENINILTSRIKYFTGFVGSLNLARNAMRNAISTVKELDKAMTAMAVVTNPTVGDYWKQLPTYTKRASEMGATIQAMYEADTLYYQQGLKTNQVMEVSNETMKMARIAGLGAAEATDRMTAAMRGFNMEINGESAQRVNDVYSKLAAITASDVNEISVAMTKTASIASSAGMQFETTAAFLSQIIETTRESAETAGTALKTVIARFEELKKDPSEIGQVDGEEVSANKIETALRSVGIALRDSEGQFRNLDEVFLELAKKWDSLDKNTQRYVATMAAGSRQQSRFIAMMQDYEHTISLVESANGAAGASQEQFNKTLESMETILNRLKNTWDTFSMGVFNSGVIKFFANLGSVTLEASNKFLNAVDIFDTGAIKLIAVFASLNAASKGFNIFVRELSRESGSLGGALKAVGSASGRRVQTTFGKFRSGYDVAQAGEVGKLLSNYSMAQGAVTPKYEEYQGVTLVDRNGKEHKYGPGEIEKAKEALDKKDKQGKLFGTKTEGSNNNQLYLKNLEAINKAEKENIRITERNNIEYQKSERAKNAVTEAGEILKSQYKFEAEDLERYNSMNELAIDTDLKAVLAKREISMADIEAIQSSEKLGGALTKEQVATNIANASAMKSNTIKLLQKIYTNKLTKALLPESVAQWAVATSQKAMATTGWEAVSAMLGLVAPIAAVIAAVGAIAYGIWQFSKAIVTLDEDIEQTKESITGLNSSIDDLKGEINELSETQEKYHSLTDELHKETIGTQEWKKKLAEVNTEVTNLIDKYPQLLGYVSKAASGELVISEDGWDAVIQEKQTTLAMKQLSKGKQEAKLADLNREAGLRQLEKQYGQGLMDKIKGGVTIEQASDLANTYEKSVDTVINAISAVNQLNETNKIQKDAINANTDAILSTLGKEGNKNNNLAMSMLEAGYESAWEQNSTKMIKAITKGMDYKDSEAMQALAEKYGVTMTGDDSKAIAAVYSAATGKNVEKVSMWDQATRNAMEKELAEIYFKEFVYQSEEAMESFSNKIEGLKPATISALEKIRNGLIDFTIEDQEEINKLIEEHPELTKDIVGLYKPKLEDIASLSEDELSGLGISKNVNGRLIKNGIYLKEKDLVNPSMIDQDKLAEIILTSLEEKSAQVTEEYIKSLPGMIGQLAEKNRGNLTDANKRYYEQLRNNVYVGGGDQGVSQVNSMIEDMVPEAQRDAFLEMLSLYTWNSTEELDKATMELAEKFELPEKKVRELTNTIGQYSNAVRNNTADLKENLKTYMAISEKSGSKDRTNRFSADDYNKLINSGKFRSSDFIEDMVSGEYVFVKPMEELTAALQQLTNAITEEKNEAVIARGEIAKMGWEDVLEESGGYFTSADNRAITSKGLLDFSAFDAETLKKATGGNIFDAESYMRATPEARQAFIKWLEETFGNLAIQEEAKKAQLDEQINSLSTSKDAAQLWGMWASNKEDKALGGAVALEASKMLTPDEINLYSEMLEKLRTGVKLTEAEETSLQKIITRTNFEEQAKGMSELSSAITDAVEGYEDLVTEEEKFNKLSKVAGKLGIDISKFGDKELDAFSGLLSSVENGSEEAMKEIVEAAYIAAGVTTSEISGLFTETGVNMDDLSSKAQAVSARLQSIGLFNLVATTDGKSKIDWSQFLDQKKSSGGGSSSPWENPYDWLYNINEQINKQIYLRERMERKYQLAVKDSVKTTQDLYDISKKELDNLREQAKLERMKGQKAVEEAQLLMKQNKEFSNYASFNSITGQIQVDYNALNKKNWSSEKGGAFEAFVGRLEELREELQESQTSLEEIEDTIEEIRDRGKDEFLSLEKRVQESLVSERQQIIDSQSQINESINKAQEKLVNSIQEQVQETRRIRENQEEAKNIEDKRQRLAYLRRDTSGANVTSILALEEEIRKAEQGYTDKLTDQSIQNLQKVNEKAAEQRQEQIDIMNSQLTAWQESGAIWVAVNDLLTTDLSESGVIGGNLRDLLTAQELTQAMSTEQYNDWLTQLEGEGKLARLFMDSNLANAAMDTYNEVVKEEEIMENTQKQVGVVGNKIADLGNILNVTGKNFLDAIKGSGGGGQGTNEYLAALLEALGVLTKKITTVSSYGAKDTQDYSAKIDKGWEPVFDNYGNIIRWIEKRYATGGLNTTTGPAWLDGTPSKPEYVLNAAQTEAFFDLVNSQTKLAKDGVSSSTSGDNYFDIDINVDKLESDYDVDRVADKIRKSLWEDSQYRNVNFVDRLK